MNHYGPRPKLNKTGTNLKALVEQNIIESNDKSMFS